MKKKQILCLAAALLTLCSCAAQTPSAGPSSTPETSGALPEAAPAGALIPLTAGSEAGYYTVGETGGWQLLCYIDYAQAVEVPLCTSPSCAHDGESCTAWIPEEEFITSLVCVNENTIAFLRNTPDGGAAVELADVSGANRRVLYTAESGQFLQTLACADGEALYCILEDALQASRGTWLYRIPLDGSAAEAVRKFPDPVPEVRGVIGNDLVLYQYDWGDTTEEAEQNGCEHRVFLWNPETGEERTLDTWHSGYGSSGRTVCWSDGRLYWSADNAPDAVHWLDAQGGSGQTDVAWPEEITSADEATFTLERVTGGYALVTVWGPWGPDLLKRYAVDLSGESAVPAEIPLRFVSNASEKPIEILAETGDELLVHFAQQDELLTQVGEDGYLSRTFEITNRCGLISWQDFLAGSPNYREVIMQ